MSDKSASVLNCINNMVVELRKLPGGEDLELEETDLADLAEKELLAAAAAIEESAAKLMSRTKRVESGIVLEEEGIADAIIDAARAITMATKTLVQAATVVQREIAARGRALKAANPYKKDPAWAEGLISAARAGADTTEDMVIVANDASMKQCGEDMVVAAVQGVAGATARLVAASRAKADPNSPSKRKLEAASKAVSKATDSLATAVKEAEKPSEVRRERDESAMQARRRRLEERARILRLEKELEQARQAERARNKATYQ